MSVDFPNGASNLREYVSSYEFLNQVLDEFLADTEARTRTLPDPYWFSEDLDEDVADIIFLGHVTEGAYRAISTGMAINATRYATPPSLAASTTGFYRLHPVVRAAALWAAVDLAYDDWPSLAEGLIVTYEGDYISHLVDEALCAHHPSWAPICFRCSPWAPANEAWPPGGELFVFEAVYLAYWDSLPWLLERMRTLAASFLCTRELCPHDDSPDWPCVFADFWIEAVDE